MNELSANLRERWLTCRQVLMLRFSIAAVLLTVVVVFQWRDGAYRAEFGWYPDESGHYVTGLLIRDFIAAGTFAAPLPFAEEFYRHYPRVSFGHWPPVFHIMEAGWSLLFTPGRTSMLLLMALIVASTAVILFVSLQSRLGTLAGFGAALLFASMPAVRASTAMIMPEGLLAMLCLVAVLLYARYLRTETVRDAAWFGVVALLAILTKPNGCLLGLVPPLCVLLTRRLYLLRLVSFWLPGAIVLPVAGTWYALTLRAAHRGWEGSTDVPYLVSWVFRVNLSFVVGLAGVGILAAALVGLFYFVSRPGSGRTEPIWHTLAALWIAVLLFHSFIAPVQEPRHVLTAAAPLAAFAVAGLNLTVKPLRRLGLSAAVAGAAAISLGCLLFLLGAPAAKTKPHSGLLELAGFLDSRTEWDRGTFLVCSEAAGAEGAFVAEIAMRDKRPNHTVIRTSNWRPEATTADGLLKEMESLGVRVLVLDHRTGGQGMGGHYLFQDSVRVAPERVRLVWQEYPGIEAYQLLDAVREPKQRVQTYPRQSSTNASGK